MKRGWRLAEGGLVDRGRRFSFTFDGRPMTGLDGDTVASALLANGATIVGRSLKGHRPRGIVAAGSEEPNALVAIADGQSFEPMVRATEIPLADGVAVTSLNAWPSAAHDFGALLGMAAPITVAGFYYKTFMWPSWSWFEGPIRRLAGLGRLRPAADRTRNEHLHEASDVAIVGGGPAGLAAALALAGSGLNVVVVDDQPRLGGSLLYERVTLDGLDGPAWAAARESQLRAAGVHVLTRATAVGAYDANLLVIVERCQTPAGDRPVERLRKLAAKRVILCSGASERPIAFAGNDRPGVMLAGAVRRYVNQYAVSPGMPVALFTSNDGAWLTAFDLADRGIEIAVVVDTRPSGHCRHACAIATRGIATRFEAEVVATRGRGGLRSIEVRNRDGRRETFGAAVLGVSGGWSPLVHLAGQRGIRPDYDPEAAALRLVRLPDGWQQAGGVACASDFGAAMAGGMVAAERVAASLATATSTPDLPEIASRALGGGAPFWRARAGREDRMWVDLQSDVTVRDLKIAVRENYASAEHLKRYTTTGMAADQGRTANVNTLGILAAETARSVGDVGTTTFRPPYVAVKMSAIAGLRRGELLQARRLSPIDGEHRRLGAEMLDFGGWQRPDHYPANDGEREAAVGAEVAAVRHAAGLFDASPLGKIEVAGPDAAAFLDRFYVSDLTALKPGRIRYSMMLKEDGSVFDDGVVARLGDRSFLASPTSGHADQVAGLFERWHQTEWPRLRVAIAPVTSNWVTVAIAGPRSRDVLAGLAPDMPFDSSTLPHLSFAAGTLGGVRCRIARVSFTGELQFEVSVPSRYGAALWREALAAGAAHGIRPIGMEAWLRLRIEKGYIHVGSETDGRTTAGDLGFGLGRGLKPADFIGKRSLALPFMADPNREQLIGFRSVSGAPLEVGARVLAPDHRRPPAPTEGRVTSACRSEATGGWIALGLVARGRRRFGERVVLHQSGHELEAELVAPVFYDPDGARLRA